MQVMEGVKTSMENKGFKPYIIPEGASNGIGGLGYYKLVKQQEIRFRAFYRKKY